MPEDNLPRIRIQALKPALIAGVGQTLPVLIRVQAPEPDRTTIAERRPYHLALVIDRSGSMFGPPLAEAVRCARHIVDRLQASDHASLVVFDDRVQTLVAAGAVGDRRALHLALSRVDGGGTTNLHGGWQAGAGELLPTAGEAALARVILLSDGNANVGEITDSATIAALCAQAAERGVTTSTYGLGRDFNEQLMIDMARRGGGNHYYGETAADLFEPFAEEFDFIAALCARHVRLSLIVAPGVNLRLLNDYPFAADAGMPVIDLPDIAFSAEAWALVELEIPAGLTVEGGGRLLQAAVTAATPDGLPLSFADAALTLPVMPVAAWDRLLADPLVVARLAEVAAGRILEQARAAAERGDWNAVERLLAEARQRFAGQPWLIEVLEHMARLARSLDASRFGKEALYSSRHLNSRISAKDEAPGSLLLEASAPSFLRRRTAQGKAQFDKPGDSSK